MNKTCSKCNISKPLSEFYFRKDYNCHRKECKECHYKIQRIRLVKNKDKVSLYHKQYRELNSNHLKERSKQYYLINNDIIKRRSRLYKPTYRIKHKNDPLYKLTKNLRCRLRSALNKRSHKVNKTLDLLGCTPAELKIHLENQFTSGMSWDNYGIKGWHMDHIIPCSFFILTDYQEQKFCFHYTNIQPLWWYDNIEKRDKITK